jgi:predicted HTH domain antitoxin
MPLANEKPEQDVVSVTVELPGDVARQYGSAPAQIGRHLLEQAAVEGYRSGELSRGQVAQMLHLEWEETEEFLAEHQCNRHYGLDDLDEERKSINKIGGTT